GARGLFLSPTALFGLIHRGRGDGWRDDRPPPILCINDRTPEIARQRRAKNRPGIVARQAGEPVGGLPVGGGVKLLTTLAGVARLDRVDQRPTDAKRRSRRMHMVHGTDAEGPAGLGPVAMAVEPF